MTETPLDERKYGRLVRPKFYFDCGIGMESETARKARNWGIFYLGGALFFTGFFCLMRFGLSPAGITLGAGGLLAGALATYMHIREAEGTPPEMNWYSMAKAGLFGWDLYEQGILSRDYSDIHPGHVERGFFHFGKLSKAYLKIDDRTARVIWDKFQESKRMYCLKNDERFAEEDAVFDKKAMDFVKSQIWFETGSGELSDLMMDRDGFRDIDAFCSFIRRKVGAIVG